MSSNPPLTDNSFQRVTEVTELQGIRATHFASFQECPKRWWLQTTDRVPRVDSPYAAVGTAVHLVIEQWLRREFELFDERWPKWQAHLEEHGVNAAERIKLVKYIESLDSLGYRDRMIECELNIRCPVYEGLIPMTGHLDLIMQDPDGSLVIVDHKTNRRYESADVWSQRFQPRVYAFMARRAFPQCNGRVLFEIGYVNLGSKVRWECPLEDDAVVATRFYESIQEMNVYHRHVEWPERVGKWCGYCPVKATCHSFQSDLIALRSSLQNPGSVDADATPVARYLWLEAVLKAGKKWKDELEEILLNLATEHEGEWREGDATVKLSAYTRRVMDPHAAWSEMSHLIERIPEAAVMIGEKLDDLITFKVGGWDKLAAEEPAIKELLGRVVRQKTSDPTIQVRQKKFDASEE